VLAPVFDTLPSQIAVLDAQGGIVAVNAAWRRFGTDSGASDLAVGLGTNYLSVCARSRDACAEAGEVEDGLRRVLSGETESFELEYLCETPERPMWFQLQASRWQGGGPVRLVVSHTDITARALAERALRDADRLKDEFLVMLAHELRSPLAPLLNAARVVERTSNRSVKSIEKIRPVSFCTLRTASNCPKVVRPGLSTMKSLPWRIASIARSARSLGMAAQVIRWMLLSSSNCARSLTRGIYGNFSMKPCNGMASSRDQKPTHSAPMSSRLVTWS
jgi:signal transduction histidine kinase